MFSSGELGVGGWEAVCTQRAGEGAWFLEKTGGLADVSPPPPQLSHTRRPAPLPGRRIPFLQHSPGSCEARVLTPQVNVEIYSGKCSGALCSPFQGLGLGERIPGAEGHSQASRRP